jgi:hypothetical protein
MREARKLERAVSLPRTNPGQGNPGTKTPGARSPLPEAARADPLPWGGTPRWAGSRGYPVPSLDTGKVLETEQRQS